VVDHLRHRLCLQGQLVLRAVGRAHARIEQAQVVVDLGDGADGGAGLWLAAFCSIEIAGDSPRSDDVGLFHQLQELPRVGRERLDIAALSFA